jgi:hypothetical protein
VTHNSPCTAQTDEVALNAPPASLTTNQNGCRRLDNLLKGAKELLSVLSIVQRKWLGHGHVAKSGGRPKELLRGLLEIDRVQLGSRWRYQGVCRIMVVVGELVAESPAVWGWKQAGLSGPRGVEQPIELPNAGWVNDSLRLPLASRFHPLLRGRCWCWLFSASQCALLGICVVFAVEV